MYFRLTTLKIPPQMSFHQHFLQFFFARGSTHDSTDCWNAHRSPAARESFKCVQGWVASAGWHRPDGIGRVPPPPQTKILATPVNCHAYDIDLVELTDKGHKELIARIENRLSTHGNGYREEQGRGASSC